MAVLLQLLLELPGLAMTDRYRVNRIICFLELDGPVTHVLACGEDVSRRTRANQGNAPSISFHAFRKSSGSEKATNPYLA